MTPIAPELREAARAMCRAIGLDPDRNRTSAHESPAQWETFLPHAKAAGAVFAENLRARAEVARAAVMGTKDQVEAERLKARAEALHEAADALGGKRADGTVVEFRRR